jgi:exosome complex RNA-binding protein Rrp42 (RNase PH superfamily)
MIDLNVDLLPYSCTTSADRRELRRKQQSTTEVLRGLMIPYLCDLEELCVLPYKYVWRVNIDVVVMACDGNLVDACSWAIWGAVQDWKLPKVDALVGHDSKQDESMGNGTSTAAPKVTEEMVLDGDVAHSIVPKGVESCPIVITVCLMPKLNSMKEAKALEILDTNLSSSQEGESSKSRTCHRIPPQRKQGDAIFVTDPTLHEQQCASTQVSLGIDKEGRICGVHQYGGGGLGGGNKGTMPFHLMQPVSNVAVAMATKIRNLLVGQDLEGEAMDLVGMKSVGVRTTQGNFFQSQFELQ